ncbi:MAG: gfo/Idh/MocA family oxidoreductase [Bacteroidia bacterium]
MKNKKKVWLIGTGIMALDYAKVLKALNVNFEVIGRGEANAIKFEKETGIKPFIGGLETALKVFGFAPDYVINSVGIDKLTEVNKLLLNEGVQNILIEKPAVAYADEVFELNDLATLKKIDPLLAYNRRFYASVYEAQNIINTDEGVTSFAFEFTEWSHVIEKLEGKTQAELENWFLGNSTHVIDLAFYLGGEPKDIATFHSGKNNLKWHPVSSNYSGAGLTTNGALFSYHADWTAPGRFSVEIMTKKHRLIFRPLEKLQIQNIGSVAINMVDGIDYTLDELYKPGLYLQTKCFLENDVSRFCRLSDQARRMQLYKKMSGL